ncbi:ABC transporter ATP-binding protein [Sutcliffiella halmapala]
MGELLVSIQDLQINSRKKPILSGVNVDIAAGEIVGIIGESGSGKSMTTKAMMNLIPGNLTVQGKILFKNQDLLSMPPKEHRKLLGKEIGLIFQDYRGSFTPFFSIGKQIVETICTHTKIRKKNAKEMTLEVLKEMGLEADRVYRSYPFQLSGGQVQRAAIAMSLALQPSLLICDEITSALDVVSGELVLDYISKIRKETGCAVLMVTHDLAQAYRRTDRIYVMQEGEIVEEGLPEQIRCHHKHPYTKKLCACLLSLPEKEALATRKRVISL